MYSHNTLIIFTCSDYLFRYTNNPENNKERKRQEIHNPAFIG